MGVSEVVAAFADGLASLAAEDPDGLDDRTVRDSMLALLTCANQLDATIARYTRVFHDRELSHRDGYGSTSRWLEAYGRLSGPAAGGKLRAAQITRALPSLQEAFNAGEVDAEHVNRIGLTAERIGVDVVREAEGILVPLARVVDPDTLRQACNYLRDEALRDTTTPPDRQYARRGLTVSRINDMWHLTGILDAETGALLRSTLDAFGPKPAEGDDRSPAQRRHDALADLLNTVVRDGKAPTTGGMRPHIGLLLPVRRYADLHDHSGSPRPVPSDDGDAVPFFPTPVDGNEPAVMSGWGPIPDSLAARLSCDATLQPMLLHPENGLPLKLGRAYRNTPPALRRVLAARDPECRWPGCRIPASWCDSHHLRTWVRDHGATDVDNLVILCRYHHVCVHERGWRMDRDPGSGWITITRPDGTPYELGPSRPNVDGFRKGRGRPPPGRTSDTSTTTPAPRGQP